MVGVGDSARDGALVSAICASCQAPVERFKLDGDAPLCLTCVDDGAGATIDDGAVAHLTFRAARGRFERIYLDALMRATRGNVSEAARRASLSRPTMSEHLRTHGIDPDKFRDR